MSAQQLTFPLGRRWPLAVLLLALAWTGLALAQRSADVLTLDSPLPDDFYAAGREVRLLAPAAADLVIAGERLEIAAPVGADLIAAGREIRVLAAVEDDLRAAGADVVLQDRIGGHLAAAGNRVTLAAGATVEDRAWLAGNALQVLGEVGGALWAAGNRVEILGVVGGDVEVRADELIIGPQARIQGSLTLHAEQEPTIAPGARIQGEVTHDRSAAQEGGGGLAGLSLLLGCALAAALLYLARPAAVERMAAQLLARPLRVLGAGAAFVLLLPLLVVLLFLTMAGAYLALGLSALYLALLIFGLALGLCLLGFAAWALARRPPPARSAALGLIAASAVAAWLLSLVPILGGLLFVALLLAGCGALVLGALSRPGGGAYAST